MKVVIKKIGINGEGIGYLDKLPVFIPGARMGEEVDIQIVEKKKRYAIGKLNRILQQSKDRIKSKCFLHARCSACPLMDVRYPKQKEYKQDILKQTLIKYAQLNPRLIEKMIGSEEIFAYRNQLKLPCAMVDGRLTTGMYRGGSNYFIEVNQCCIHEEGLEKIKTKVLDVLNRFSCVAYDYHTKKGIRTLVIRGFEGKYQCTLVTGNDELNPVMIEQLMQISGMHSLWQSVNTVKKTPEIFGSKTVLLAGEQGLPFTLKDVKLNISPRSFFQLNTKQAVRLYETIASFVSDNNDFIVEAYSGIGAISLFLKDKAKEIVGIETIKDAVVNASANAKLNHADHVSFVCDDAANKLEYLSKKRKIDVLVVDPPRTGLDDAMLSCILKSKIKKIVYVSCNPATLGKNLYILQSKYRVEKVQPIDMFPHTAGIETVCLLVKK